MRPKKEKKENDW